MSSLASLLANPIAPLYVGCNVAASLYGLSCLQTFIYVTSYRTKQDRPWLKLGALLDTVHQALLVAAIYRFLITDAGNPLAALNEGPGSGDQLIYIPSIISTCLIFLIQLFFCWRIWTFSGLEFKLRYRVVVSAFTTVIALFTFASTMYAEVIGFHNLLLSETTVLGTWVKISRSAGITLDIVITLAMSYSLFRARSGVRGSDQVVKSLILFTVNTGMITTLLSITELVLFIYLPGSFIYVGIDFVTTKTYINFFLAVLNSREYFQRRLRRNEATPLKILEHGVIEIQASISSFQAHPESTGQTAVSTGEQSTWAH